MQYAKLEEIKPFDSSEIDRTLSSQDLTQWAKLRFAIYLALGSDLPYTAEA